MYVPFEQLPKTARVWIYQASRALTTEELLQINQALVQFSGSWDSHGAILQNSFEVLYDRFIVFAVDESHHIASGCSIDKSVNLMKLLSEQLQVDLLDKTQIAYFTKENTIASFDFKKTKECIASKTIDIHTEVFNNLVDNIADFQVKWKINIENTWLEKYFK